MTLIDFTLSNARRFYPSMGNPSDTEGLRSLHIASMLFAKENDRLALLMP